MNSLNIKVVVDEAQDPQEITIVVHHMSDEIKRIVQELNQPILMAFKRGSEFPLVVNDVLFFEVEEDNVYAHLVHTSYLVRQRLYELENLLPTHFVRISKSSIVNIQHIASIHRDLSTVREIGFHQSHKVIYVSRKYYPVLRNKMEERTL